jgi:hypothetical protein
LKNSLEEPARFADYFPALAHNHPMMHLHAGRVALQQPFADEADSWQMLTKE